MLHEYTGCLQRLLVVDRRSILWVEVDCLLDQLVTLILKLLPHSNLSSVETLPIVAVDWLRGGRPEGERERDVHIYKEQDQYQPGGYHRLITV